jgi:hypothetical protein
LIEGLERLAFDFRDQGSEQKWLSFNMEVFLLAFDFRDQGSEQNWLSFNMEVFLRYTIPPCTAGLEGLVCNRKELICKDSTVDINFVPPAF